MSIEEEEAVRRGRVRMARARPEETKRHSRRRQPD
jgi:hypothetical protein